MQLADTLKSLYILGKQTENTDDTSWTHGHIHIFLSKQKPGYLTKKVELFERFNRKYCIFTHKRILRSPNHFMQCLIDLGEDHPTRI